MSSNHETAMDITANTMFRVAGDPISTSIPGEAVILDSRSGRYFSLEGVGARIWELLQEPKPLSEIVRILLDEYEVDEVTCERDVSVLMDRLRAAGLVETAK